MNLRNRGSEIGLALAVCTFVIIALCCAFIGPSVPLNFLFVFCGGLIGWTLGVFITPIDPKEQSKFTQYGKFITAFITGFLVSKIDKVFELVTQKPNAIDDVFQARFLFFVTSFFLGLLCTFIWRSYISKN